MKKRITAIIACILILSLAGCGIKSESQEAKKEQIANPWHSYETLELAEAYAGFELGMPETVSSTYKAEAFNVLEGEDPLLEVEYKDDEFTVVIRKSRVVGQDISGVYGFENESTAEQNGVTIRIYRPSDKSEMPNAFLALFDYDGFAWSMYAPNGYWGDSCVDFWTAVFNKK